jgi:bifunctional non-homologous end joining protein LigD
VIGDGPIFFREACRHGLEGIISKRRDRPYSPGRGMDWLKVKCKARAELVIGGYTDPSGPRTGFGSLLAGYYPKTVKRGTARDKRQGNGHRKLIYAGRVGTGFNLKSLETLYRRLRALEQKDSPFESVIEQGRPLYLRRGARGLHWVKPILVCEVEFTNWTRDGLLRHPSFVGLRVDKAATEVVREKEVV